MVKILIPSGALGLGYDQTALDRGVAMGPDLIAIDGSSTDSGPSYLGRGVSKYARASTKMEWAGLIRARAAASHPPQHPVAPSAVSVTGSPRHAMERYP